MHSKLTGLCVGWHYGQCAILLIWQLRDRVCAGSPSQLPLFAVGFFVSSPVDAGETTADVESGRFPTPVACSLVHPG